MCAFVAIVKVESNEVDTSIECLINYLRQQKYDDDAFDSIATFSTLSDACKRRIRSEMDLVFILAHQKYEAKQEYQKYLECFMESIKNDENFLHLLLKRKAIESIKLSWKAKLNPNNWIPGKKHKGLKNVGKAIDEIEFENLFVCEYGKKFAEAFEIIFEPHKINLRSVDEVQCMRMEPNASKIALEATERSLNCDDVLADARVNVAGRHDGYRCEWREYAVNIVDRYLQVIPGCI